MTLILLRHGQSQWNLENRFTGFHDVDITAEGESEARKAGLLLKDYFKERHSCESMNLNDKDPSVRWDDVGEGLAVFTSTLKRARRTAEIALSEAGQESMIAQMSLSDALRERDYGALTGLNKAETAIKYGEEQVHIWRRSYDVPPPEGESLKDVVARVGLYYEHVMQPVIAANKTTLVAAHGNSLRALLIILGQETPETIMARELATGVPIFID